MLGKTANGLFWMYRYLERAENTARMIETGQRLALTGMSGGDGEWASVLQTAAAQDGYHAAHGEVLAETAIDWLLRAKDNPSSTLSCIGAARQNARLVRTAITGEVWEAVNACFMSAKAVLARKVSERDLPAVLSKLRQQTALVRGMTHGTMLRNDIYDFARIGTFLERADNTARILDVKYYVLLPTSSGVGSSMDNVQWENILRSVSARGGFRMEYGTGAGPREIVSFLTLDRRMPRSLAFCVSKLADNLGYLQDGAEGDLPAREMVLQLERDYLSKNVDQIFDHGLHEFIQAVLERLAGIARQIETDFRFYE